MRVTKSMAPADWRLRVPITLACLVITSIFMMPIAISANQDVPRNLLSYRAKLLELRDSYLGQENAQNRCLNEDDAIIRQVDKILIGNPINRQALLAVRYEHVRCIDRHNAYLGSLNSSISKIDSELSRVESDIKYWACLR